MKVAIVGTTSKMNESQESDMRRQIVLILKRYDKKNTLIISGGAKGVDLMAIEIADRLGFETKEFPPDIEEWNPPNDQVGYKKRNIQIAEACDELHCLTIALKHIKCYHHNTPQDHEKTAGCFTAKEAFELGKPNMLVVIP